MTWRDPQLVTEDAYWLDDGTVRMAVRCECGHRYTAESTSEPRCRRIIRGKVATHLLVCPVARVRGAL